MRRSTSSFFATFTLVLTVLSMVLANSPSFLQQGPIETLSGNTYSSYKEVDTSQESDLVKALINLREKNSFSSGNKQESMRLLQETVSEFNLEAKAITLDNSCSKRRQEGNVADFYYFLPNFYGSVSKQGDTLSFESPCFKKNSFTLVSLSNTEAHFELTSTEPKGILCEDYHLLATSRITSPETVFLHGTHKIVLKKLTEKDLEEVKTNGFRLLGFCENIFKTLVSLEETARLYLGGFSTKNAHVTPHMEKSNLDFIKRYVGLNYSPRNLKAGSSILPIDKKDIHTGDFIAIVRLDGLDQLIQMGTGSSIGHSAVAAWIDDELYVIESQDGWYWPKHGIQRNTWDEWVQAAHNADFHVILMPLKEEIRAKLDTQKAVDWFVNSMEGLNYGYHNFLLSWFDTHKNLPVYIDAEVLLPLLGIFARVSRTTFDLILGEALNQRTNTKNLNLTDVLAEGAKLGYSFEDLLALPELESFRYSDGPNYVCSCFVIGFYKAGGLFGDLEIQAQEFTPKDLYQLSFFEQTPSRPDICKEYDPEYPFCQIMGKYNVEFRGVGSVEIYNKMNERCESQAPDFVRNEGC